MLVRQSVKFDTIYHLIISTAQLKAGRLCDAPVPFHDNSATTVLQPAKTFQSLSILIRPKRNLEC